MTVAAVDWTAVGIVGALITSLLGSMFGLYQARKADRSATTTKTIELGVKDLIDQYQERQVELKSDVAECTKKCAQLEAKCDHLEDEVERLTSSLEKANTHIDNLESEIIRLRRLTGEIP